MLQVLCILNKKHTFNKRIACFIFYNSTIVIFNQKSILIEFFLYNIYNIYNLSPNNKLINYFYITITYNLHNVVTKSLQSNIYFPNKFGALKAVQNLLANNLDKMHSNLVFRYKTCIATFGWCVCELLKYILYEKKRDLLY